MNFTCLINTMIWLSSPLYSPHTLHHTAALHKLIIGSHLLFPAMCSSSVLLPTVCDQHCHWKSPPFSHPALCTTPGASLWVHKSQNYRGGIRHQCTMTVLTVSANWEQHWKQHWVVYIRHNVDLWQGPWGPPKFSGALDNWLGTTALDTKLWLPIYGHVASAEWGGTLIRESHWLPIWA